jgi:hypothetical protein
MNTLVLRLRNGIMTNFLRLLGVHAQNSGEREHSWNV